MSNIQIISSHKIDSKASSYIIYLLGLSYVDRIIDFLDPQKGTKDTIELYNFFENGVLPFGEELNVRPIDALNYSEEDIYSVYAINLGINYWVRGYSYAIKDLSKDLLDEYNLKSNNNLDNLFFSNLFYIYCI